MGRSERDERKRGKETVKAPERLNRGSGKVSETVASECV